VELGGAYEHGSLLLVGAFEIPDPLADGHFELRSLNLSAAVGAQRLDVLVLVSLRHQVHVLNRLPQLSR